MPIRDNFKGFNIDKQSLTVLNTFRNVEGSFSSAVMMAQMPERKRQGE